METYLVEIVYKTYRGSGTLRREYVQAYSPRHAYKMVATIHGTTGEVIDAYVRKDR